MFWDGSVCISCPSPGKFSQETFKCECPEQKSYNEEKQICVFGNGVIAYVPNLAATSNWVYGDAGKDAYNSWLASVNSEITTQECPVDAPYLDNHDKCVVCGEGELFDLSTTKCTTCNDG
jgi:ribosomal protein L37E